MAPQEHRPIADPNPPYALAGLVVGVIVGVAGIVVHRHAAPPIVEAEPAPVAVVDAPAPVAAGRALAPSLPVQPAITAPRVQPGLPAFPGQPGYLAPSTQMGLSTLDRRATVALYANAFGPYARVTEAGDYDVVRLDAVDYANEALIRSDENGAVHVYATARTFARRRPPPTASLLPPTCGPFLRFVATVGGANVMGGGGSSGDDETGQCTWYTASSPQQAIDDVAESIFGAGEHERQTWDGRGLVRAEVRGLRNNIY